MKWCEPYLAVMIIGWLSTQHMCLMTSGQVFFVAMATLNFKKGIFLNDISFKTTEAVWLWFCTNVAWVRQFKIAKIILICLLIRLPWQQKAHTLIMRRWLNFIFFIISEVMWTIFGSYAHWMIVYPVYVFYDQWIFSLVAKATLNFKKGIC